MFAFVCLWLDHYLHQHSGCGPMGATWLGGVATFTTTRDRCIETILYPSMIVVGCVHLVLQFTKYASCDLCFHWDVVHPV